MNYILFNQSHTKNGFLFSHLDAVTETYAFYFSTCLWNRFQRDLMRNVQLDHE